MRKKIAGRPRPLPKRPLARVLLEYRTTRPYWIAYPVECSAQDRGEFDIMGSYKSFLSRDDFWDIYAIDTVGRSPFGLRPRSAIRETIFPPSPPADRRHHSRRNVTCRVDYASPGRFAGVGLITNLSMNGLFMEHVPELGVGDRVTVVFGLPSSSPFKLKGKVKWLNTHGVGLEFDSPSNVAGFSASHETESLSLYRAWLSRN